MDQLLPASFYSYSSSLLNTSGKSIEHLLMSRSAVCVPALAARTRAAPFSKTEFFKQAFLERQLQTIEQADAPEAMNIRML